MYHYVILLASYSVTENSSERPWQTVGIHQNGSGDRRQQETWENIIVRS